MTHRRICHTRLVVRRQNLDLLERVGVHRHQCPVLLPRFRFVIPSSVYSCSRLRVPLTWKLPVMLFTVEAAFATRALTLMPE